MPEPDQNPSQIQPLQSPELSGLESSGPDRVSGPVALPVLHIHPSLRCNLTCRHCYSDSGPSNRISLPIETVRDAISDAAEMGYRVVSVSGGEPFLYPELPELLAHAKTLGLSTTVITNGFFFQPRWLQPVQGLIDVLAISLDGPPEMHNRMRRSPDAFDRVSAGLETLRALQMPFGIIHTVTSDSLDHLLWLADFAATNGATLLQFHPLEMAGRAERELQSDAPEADVLSHAYLLTFVLAAQYQGQMSIHCDLLHSEYIQANPELIYAGNHYAGNHPESDSVSATPASLLSLIVLESDGTIVPASYGFSRSYQLCNIHQQRLSSVWPAFLEQTYPRFRNLCRELYDDILSGHSPALFNWHDTIVARSHNQHRAPSLVSLAAN